MPAEAGVAERVDGVGRRRRVAAVGARRALRDDDDREVLAGRLVAVA